MKKIINTILIINIILMLMQPIIYAVNDTVYQTNEIELKQEAIIETALAYVAKGKSIQYDQYRMCQYTNSSETLVKILLQ